MLSDFKQHRHAYIVLVVVLFLFVTLFMHFWPNKMYQRVVLVSMSLFYFTWGVFVHTKMKHISKIVVYEYLAIAILAGSILTLLTF